MTVGGQLGDVNCGNIAKTKISKERYILYRTIFFIVSTFHSVYNICELFDLLAIKNDVRVFSELRDEVFGPGPRACGKLAVWRGAMPDSILVTKCSDTLRIN